MQRYSNTIKNIFLLHQSTETKRNPFSRKRENQRLISIPVNMNQTHQFLEKAKRNPLRRK